MKRFVLIAALLLAASSSAHTVPSAITVFSATRTLKTSEQYGGATFFMAYTVKEQVITLAGVAPDMYVCFNNYAGIYRKTVQPAAGDRIILDGRNLGFNEAMTSKTDGGEEVCLKGVDSTTWVSYGNSNFGEFILETDINYQIHNSGRAMVAGDCDGFARMAVTADGGDAEFDLPTSPSNGDQCHFVQLGTRTITIDPAAGHTILGNAAGAGALAAGGAIISGNKENASMVLEYNGASGWFVTEPHGPWRKAP